MSLKNRGWSRRQFMWAAGSAGMTGLLPSKLQLAAFGQTTAVGTESDKGVAGMKYLPEWTSPLHTSVPEWARPGRIRFARWDGGPLEATKAVLSGWPEFSPADPNYLNTMVRWYDPSTIAFLREAHINLIWVTFSNGFSNETERQQQESLRTYIGECHRQGIRTIAYESLTNMFFDDMFEHVPKSRKWLSLDKHGNPISYGSADYKKAGRITRYLADISNEDWLNYVKKRIDLAIEAGADGVMYDNCFGSKVLEAFQKMMPYASSKKSGFLVMANFHREQFIYNRLLNAITTEEGGEAGIFSGEKMAATNNRWQKERDTMVQLDGGFLANNLGRMRVFANLSEGWRPFMIESRIREDAGMAETHIMPPDHQKLAMAENMIFNSAYEPSVEIEFAQGLWNKKPEAEKAWEAIATYNRFAMQNEEYFVGALPLSSIAIVLDNRTDGVELLNGLAGRNLQYDIIYEHQLTSERMKPYRVVAVLTATMIRSSAVGALQDFVAGGGKLFVGGDSATSNEIGLPTALPSWIGTKTAKGESTYWKQLPEVDRIASQLRAADPSPLIQIAAPRQILYSVMQQPAKGRILIHFANYEPRSAGKCAINIHALPHAARLLSPDKAASMVLPVQKSDGHARIEIDGIDIYSVLILEMKANRASA